MAATEQTAKKDVATREPTFSERFTGMVVKEFTATVGDVAKFTEEQRRLAQHLFVKIDSSLNALEAKRLKDGKAGLPIAWANINMQKLALDAMHRIELGLDALIPNHIHPIPYMNSKTGKYDLDLRIGYAGKDYYRRRVALIEPLDIIYELVYSTDEFTAKKKTFGNEVESYTFEIKNPFERGEIVGGFGYIVYEDPKRNKLVILSEKDFQKARKLAKSADFWNNYPTEMKLKTLVLRTTDKLTMDPRKVNASFAAVEDEDIEAEIDLNANKDVIDTTAEPVGGDNGGNDEAPPMSEQEKAQSRALDQENAGQEQAAARGPGF